MVGVERGRRALLWGAWCIAPAPSSYGPAGLLSHFEIIRGGRVLRRGEGAAPSAPPLATALPPFHSEENESVARKQGWN